MGKTPVKHFSSLFDNTGPGVATIFGHVIYRTDVGLRVQAGSTATIKDSATTGNVCNVGDLIKYVHVCIQCSPRGASPTNDNDNAGWLEWALIFQREQDKTVTVANIGTGTLGQICTNYYREDCLMTGCFPIGTKQAMSTDLPFKLPEKCTKLRQGYILTILCYVRTSLSTDMRTDSHRLIASSGFKCYT